VFGYEAHVEARLRSKGLFKSGFSVILTRQKRPGCVRTCTLM